MVPMCVVRVPRAELEEIPVDRQLAAVRDGGARQ